MNWKKYAKLSALLMPMFFSFIFPQAAPGINDLTCLDCHGQSEIHKIQNDGTVLSLFVNASEWQQDVHKKSGMTCIDCHVNASPILHFREGFPNIDCASCHPEEEEEYTKNIHFEHRKVSANKELPQCYHCHTKHRVLLHDDVGSSVHEDNIGETCGQCHVEVMVAGILKGSSLGKISGHRKGDLSARFDMNICLSCHYGDSAHGAKRIYKEYCTRCHDPEKKGNPLIGPAHLNSSKWSIFNYIGSGLSLFFFLGLIGCIGYNSRKKIRKSMQNWLDKMKMKEETPQAEEKNGPKNIQIDPKGIQAERPEDNLTEEE